MLIIDGGYIFFLVSTIVPSKKVQLSRRAKLAQRYVAEVAHQNRGILALFEQHEMAVYGGLPASHSAVFVGHGEKHMVVRAADGFNQRWLFVLGKVVCHVEFPYLAIHPLAFYCAFAVARLHSVGGHGHK